MYVYLSVSVLRVLMYVYAYVCAPFKLCQILEDRGHGSCPSLLLLDPSQLP